MSHDIEVTRVIMKLIISVNSIPQLLSQLEKMT